MAQKPSSSLCISDARAFQSAFGVSRETVDNLETYAALLRKWQATINLVAPSTLEAVWHRHFADSAQLVQHIPAEARTCVDLGSGAGFPGLVLAILFKDRALAGRAEKRFTLVESDTRKAAFLAEVARKTGTAVDIRAKRIEFLSTQDKVAAVDVVTARALAPMIRLLGLMEPLIGAKGQAVLLKGREAEAEISEAREKWQFEASLAPSLTEPGACVVTIKNLKAKTEG